MRVARRTWCAVLVGVCGAVAAGQTPGGGGGGGGGVPPAGSPPGVQPVQPVAPPPEKKLTLDAVAPAQHALIRQRARQFYRMPDGTIWDGAMFFEYRKVLDRNLKAYDRMQPHDPPPATGSPGPGVTFTENKPIGTVWKLNQTQEVEAWALEENLADRDGVVGGLDRNNSRAHDENDRGPARGLETVDPHSWRAVPPLWTSLEGGSYSWPFAYVDETEPDLYTRTRHKHYLEVTRIWGDGRFEFKGYALDMGAIEGVIRVDDPKKYVAQDRFKGQFFLWPDGEDPVAKQRLWRLIPADEARTTPDDLADALMHGKAELATWGLERIRGKLLWKRTVREVQEAVIAPPKPKVPPPPPSPTPSLNDVGPDLVILSDGRWFRGRVTKHDEQELTIVTRMGQGEMPMTFKMGEVKEVQTPERR